MDRLIERNKHHLEFSIMVVVFIVFFGLLLYLLKQPDERVMNNNNKLPSTAKNEAQAGAWMKVEPVSGTVYNVGDTVDLLIKADSDGANVEGYDILFPYPQGVEVINIRSMMKDFQIFPARNSGYISITGIKLLTVKEPTLFKGEGLVDLTVKITKAGSYNFGVQEARGRERTKLVDDKTAIIIPDTISTIVQVN